MSSLQKYTFTCLQVSIKILYIRKINIFAYEWIYCKFFQLHVIPIIVTLILSLWVDVRLD